MSDDPSVRLVLGAGVVDLLVALAEQLEGVHASVLGDLPDEADDTAVTPPDGLPRDDQLWNRLYPRASEDHDTDQDLRQLLQADLADERRRELAALVEVLVSESSPRDDGTAAVHLDDEQAGMVLRTTHALMVALAVRANPDIFTDRRERLPRTDDATRAGQLTDVIDLLQGLQEFVIAQLDPGARSHYDLHGDLADDQWEPRWPGDDADDRGRTDEPGDDDAFDEDDSDGDDEDGAGT